MADYIEPTKTEFNNAEQVAVDVVSQAYPNIVTKTGSIIRELVVRPASYLMSWVTTNLTNDIKRYSIAYLKNSQLTVNPVADLVASNYFVSRKQGTRAKGVVTLTLSTDTLRLAAGSRFTVGGVQMITEKQYLITPDPGVDSELLGYLKAIRVGDTYIANIPIIAAAPGNIELPVGSPVTLGFSCVYYINVELTSPVTGGSGVETDAQLMARAEYNTAEAGIGSYYGIKKKLTKAPVYVAGMSVIAGEDAPLFRARNNSVGINPGGYVDCHVKTDNQASIGTVTGLKLSGATVGNITIPEDVYPGFIRVVSVVVAGSYRNNWSVVYKTADPLTTAQGARLSVDQRAEIHVPLTENESATIGVSGTTDTAVTVEYMPGLKSLQQYMDGDNERFIGQDIKVKAAVPVNVGVSCSVYSQHELDPDALDGIKQAIVDYINNTQVGVGKLNFSDIKEACERAYPNVVLRLPCVLTATVSLKDGLIDTFSTTSGILDITNNPTYNQWGYQICYFGACKDNIRLSIV